MTKETTLSYNASLRINDKPVTLRRHEYWDTQDQANRRIKNLLKQNHKHEGEIIYSDFRTDTIYKVTTSL